MRRKKSSFKKKNVARKYPTFITKSTTKPMHIDTSKDLLRVTLTGGGGSGGIGYVDGMTYYAGGGGGSGATIVDYPVNIKSIQSLTIIIGKGGKRGNNGESTIVDITYTNGCKKQLVGAGGLSGMPNASNRKNTSMVGGIGGNHPFLPHLNGLPGLSGCVTLPSQMTCRHGASAYGIGGSGGASYHREGGHGGHMCKLGGYDGRFGSGGGGSCPRSSISENDSMVGKGGDGLVLLSYY